jgi:NAD(P)-dependent dehydrogenase (short-subunit alcohol dehydrogenase family)
MSGLLKSKIAVVTGGSSGVGRAIAVAFAEQGAAAVVIADIRRGPREGGTPTDELVRQLGVESTFVETDVASVSSIEDAIAAADDLGQLSIMVNSAGVFRREPFLEVSDDELDRVYRVNVRGTFFGCQKAAAVMTESGGSIINISSVAAYRGGPLQSAYSMSKGAVRSLTYAAAKELAPMRIRVNAIHPGAVETEMTRTDGPDILSPESLANFPMGPARSVDIANSAVFLASDLSSHISGASLTVDGASGSMG